MSEESTPITAPSEQPVVADTGSSEQGKAAEATQPAAEVKAPEPEPKVDLEAIRREAAEKVRHDLESQFGKKLSETRREERERARQEREQLITGFSDFVPEEQLQRMRETHTQKEQQAEKDAKLAYLEAELAKQRTKEELEEARAAAEKLASDAGYELDNLPREVLGPSPYGFEKRFSAHVAKENAKLKKDMEVAVKKAAEDAVRETERRLGVTRVSGAEPLGKGASTMDDLKQQMADASARGDKDKMKEVRDALYREVGIGR